MSGNPMVDLVLYLVIFHHAVFALALVLVGLYWLLGQSVALLGRLWEGVGVCIIAVLWLFVELVRVAVFVLGQVGAGVLLVTPVLFAMPFKLIEAGLALNTQRAERARLVKAMHLEAQRVAEIRRVGEVARGQMNALYTQYQANLRES